MIFTGLLAVSMSLVMAASSGHIDVDYEGEVDIFNGVPSVSENAETSNIVELPDGGKYNRKTHMFEYYASGVPQAVLSSVADGMMTTKSVSVEFENGLTAKLFRDGKELEEAEIGSVKEPGKYSVVVTGSDVETQLLSFTILSGKTGAVDSYKLPEGFYLTALSVDGEDKDIADDGAVDLSTDGKYNITCHCALTDIDYSLSVEIDHTPPDIKYETLENGKSRGAVTVTGVEKSDKVAVKKDGADIKFPSDGMLKMPGKYEVTVTDDAGNSVTESFTISFYLNYQGVLFGVLLFATIAAVVIYMIITKRKLRVR